MKLCITSNSAQPDAPVAPRFGRAPWFIIWDAETDTYEPIRNVQNMAAAAGAGIQSATAVARAGAEVVLTGHIGPKAISVLKEADVKVAVGAEGTVREALEAWRAGELEPTDEADKTPHW
jgi:predicted Fe-Mo cluster-binding NifX family protein